MVLSGILIPILIIVNIDFNNKNIEEVITIVGGSSAPFISISAVLIVIFTFVYQRRNDLNLQSKDSILKSLSLLKDEFHEVSTKTTTTKTDTETGQRVKTENLFQGKYALKQIVETLNSDNVELSIMDGWIEGKSMVNIFRLTDGILNATKENKYLSSNEKKMIKTQIDLFYNNNLLIDENKRGDKYCDYHRTTHKFPEDWKRIIHSIESKLKNEWS